MRLLTLVIATLSIVAAFGQSGMNMNTNSSSLTASFVGNTTFSQDFKRKSLVSFSSKVKNHRPNNLKYFANSVPESISSIKETNGLRYSPHSFHLGGGHALAHADAKLRKDSSSKVQGWFISAGYMYSLSWCVSFGVNFDYSGYKETDLLYGAYADYGHFRGAMVVRVQTPVSKKIGIYPFVELDGGFLRTFSNEIRWSVDEGIPSENYLEGDVYPVISGKVGIRFELGKKLGKRASLEIYYGRYYAFSDDTDFWNPDPVLYPNRVSDNYQVAGINLRMGIFGRPHTKMLMNKKPDFLRKRETN